MEAEVRGSPVTSASEGGGRDPEPRNGRWPLEAGRGQDGSSPRPWEGPQPCPPPLSAQRRFKPLLPWSLVTAVMGNCHRAADGSPVPTLTGARGDTLRAPLLSAGRAWPHSGEARDTAAGGAAASPVVKQGEPDPRRGSAPGDPSPCGAGRATRPPAPCRGWVGAASMAAHPRPVSTLFLGRQNKRDFSNTGTRLLPSGVLRNIRACRRGALSWPVGCSSESLL